MADHTDAGSRPGREVTTSDASLGIPGLTDPVEIGHGGFGTVYRAQQPAFHRTIAVKVLRDRVDSGLQTRFERECQALGVLSGHPNIVTIYDAGVSTHGRPYIVMDYLTGGSLRDRLTSIGRMSWIAVTDIAIKLAGGLETAHRAGVLHRDLKPDNILVSGYGEPKLGDFGIARVTGATETTTGQLTASVAHAAPELFDGKRPTVQSDLYSLGSTMFMLLAGAPAFLTAGEDSFLAVVMRASLEPVPDLRPIGVPHDLCSVIERLMAKTPSQRHATAADLGAALQHVQARAGIPITQMTIDAGPIVEPIPAQRQGDSTVLESDVDPPSPRPAVPDPRTAGPEVPRPRTPRPGVAQSPPLPAVPHRPTVLRPDPGPPSGPDRALTRRGGPLIVAAVVALCFLIIGGVVFSGVLGGGGSSGPISPPGSTSSNVPVGPLTPVRATASSVAPPGVDDAKSPITYGPENLIDGDPTTAWRTPGDGIGQVVQLNFATPVQLRRIGLIPGYAKSDPATGVDRFTQNRTVTSVRYRFDDGSAVTAQFSASPVVQSTAVEVRTMSVTIEILGTTAGGGRDFTPISEIVASGCAC